MQVRSAELLVRAVLADGGLHERRAGEIDARAVPDQHHVVGEARQVGAAGGRRSVHDRDLRNSSGRHPRLVGEAATAVHEDLGLVHQVGAARLDERDQRQLVLERDRLRAQGLLQAHRCDGAALDGTVARGDHHALARHRADPDDRAAALHALLAVVVVHAEAGERAQFQEVAATVEQARHAFARQQLPTLLEALALRLRLGDDLCLERADFTEPRVHAFRAGLEGRALRVDRGGDDGHYFSTSGPTERWNPSKGTERSWSRLGNTALPSEAPPSIWSVTPVMNAGPGTEQEKDRGAHLGLGGEAAQRHVGLEPRDHRPHRALVLVHAGGGHPARRYGIHPHAGVRPFEGGSHRQVAHAGPGGARVPHAGHAVTEIGRHVDDRAAVLLHALVEHLAHHQESAREVVGHDRVEAALRDGHQRRRKLAAGVVDEPVDRPVPRDDLPDRGPDRVFVPDVECRGLAAPAVGQDLPGDALELLLRAAAHHHGRAERGELVRDAAADAAAAAGDPDDLAGEQAGGEYAAVAGSGVGGRGLGMAHVRVQAGLAEWGPYYART